MWPDRRLLDLLGIEHPIIQAPMAGSTRPALAAAVSNAGGLGSLGCASLSVEKLDAEIAGLKAATNRSYNLNFFAHPEPREDPAAIAYTRKVLAPFYVERNLGPQPEDLTLPFTSFSPAQLQRVLEARPAVVSFHFGLPPKEMLDAIKATGARILCSATRVKEAVFLEQNGVDAIIAQGYEAGGHRGSFVKTAPHDGIGLMSLLPQIVDAVSVPVIAAGGIADGRGIAAALMLGACGVQMGTAFLSTPESAASDAERRLLEDASDEDTAFSLAFSGRPARAVKNRYSEAMVEHGTKLADFPLMYPLAGPLRKPGPGADDFGYALYGQSAAMNRVMPAADLVKLLVDEARACLGNR